MNTTKEKYVSPRVEAMELRLEGVIALSPGYTEWPDLGWSD